jgi:hypothetical protein
MLQIVKRSSYEVYHDDGFALALKPNTVAQITSTIVKEKKRRHILMKECDTMPPKLFREAQV